MPCCPGPEAAGAAVTSARGPTGRTQASGLTPTHPPCPKSSEEREKHKPETTSGADEHKSCRELCGRRPLQLQTWTLTGGSYNTPRIRVTDENVQIRSWQIPWNHRILGALQHFCSRGSSAAPAGGFPQWAAAMSPGQEGEAQHQHGSCPRRRGRLGEKHCFWVQIIVPHIPLFAIVISIVILLDKQTSEKMQ